MQYKKRRGVVRWWRIPSIKHQKIIPLWAFWLNSERGSVICDRISRDRETHFRIYFSISSSQQQLRDLALLGPIYTCWNPKGQTRPLWKRRTCLPNTRKILRPPSSHQHNAMLLQVVPLSRNIRQHILPGCQLHPRDLSLRRVRLLRLHSHHGEGYALSLVTPFECRGFATFGKGLAGTAHDLVDRC